MGLFKKRADPAEMERLRAEIQSMSARLSAADAAKQQLDERVQNLTQRLDTPLTTPPSTPPPKPGGVDPAEVDRLRSDLLRLSTRVDERPATPRAPTVDPADLAAVRDEVGRLHQRLDEQPPVVPGSDPAELAEVRTMVERLTTRLDEVDARITSISTELANQISEISNDVEAIGGAEPPTDEVVDELRGAQTRLANEQARYQIAFRHDLAELAERLKHS
ncbi:MAG: hypothetical protein CL424_07330 [Acidimicrobiaceae bacterium]|nr:hypothetical protein [Acidimicrobiaceae bacterium]